ncbi:MAG: 50S ribosomal protein L18Ae [Candidatus Jordarchaeales archaeon]
MQDNEVKVFRIEGYYVKKKVKKNKYFFVDEIRALKKDHALELIYSNIGSRHRVKRRNIVIEKVEVIKPEEAESPIVRILSGVEM